MGAYNNLIKPFLPEKFQKRVAVPRTLEELHERIPASIIPVELVGAGGLLPEEKWRSWGATVDNLVADAKTAAEAAAATGVEGGGGGAGKGGEDAEDEIGAGQARGWWERWVDVGG